MEVVDGSVGVPAADPVEAEREEEGAGSVGSAGVPAADPKMETEEKDTGSVGSAGVPATDPAPDEAAEESEFEPDWDDPRPIDPEREHLTTASDFGLGQAFRKYTKLTQTQLELQLVPLLRLQFGEDELISEWAKQNDVPCQMLDDAIILRRQHENNPTQNLGDGIV